MDDEQEGKRKKRARQGDASSGVSLGMTDPVVTDGKVFVMITDIMVWSKLSRGEYNRNQAYAHLSAEPASPWLIGLPIGDKEGPEAITAAIDVLQDAVHAAVKRKVEEFESEDRAETRSTAAKKVAGRAEARTEIRSMGERNPGRPSVDAAAGDPPPDDEPEF